MSLYVLEFVLWIFGIRGHIPQSGGFVGPAESLAGSHPLMRVLAGVFVGVALLSIVLWTAVWLAIRLL